MTVPERIEVYVDEGTTPVQILSAPPCDLTLDTTTVADGGHTLRFVTRFADGRTREERVGIVVRNHREELPTVAIKGLEDGTEVSGTIRATVLVQPVPARGQRRLSWVASSLVIAAVFVGIWALFALGSVWMPASGTRGAPQGPAPVSGAAPAAPAASAAAIKAGAEQFRSQSCGGCHTISGTAAAGTVGPNLTHIGSLLSRSQLETMITNGNDGMPAFDKIRGADLNALLDYLQSLK